MSAAHSVREAALRRQQARLQRRIAALEQRDARLSWLRLALFVVGVGAVALAVLLGQRTGALLLLALAMVAFALVVALHRRVTESLERHRAWHQLQTRQLARLHLDWDALPPATLRPRPAHPFERDYDLLGERSLHRLIDLAITQEGSTRLRDWLGALGPQPDASLARQEIVRELQPRVRLRNRLLVRAALVAGRQRPWSLASLHAWSQAQPAPRYAPWLAAATALLVATFLLLLGDVVANWPPLWLGSAALYAMLHLRNLSALGELFDEALALRGLVARMRALFIELERFPYVHTPRLAELCAPFRDSTRRPSRWLKQVESVVNATGLRGNPLLHLLLNLVLPWDFLFAWRLEQLQAQIAQHLPDWLDRWATLEACASLANLGYLNPQYSYPEWLSDADPRFEARQLGHPLIPVERKVRNDFRTTLGEITILTGSNMAGKSAFLKALGLNLALAQAGGPVDADRLATTPFRLFASIRVTDSVTDGISYFYAEVQRLRALLDALEQEAAWPLFFMVDEIFRGTNNRERLIGSRALIQRMAGQRGIGLIATHDLELVQLAERSPHIRNRHFEERVVDGKMDFAYQLLDGPSTTTNALLIMQSAGLLSDERS